MRQGVYSWLSYNSSAEKGSVFVPTLEEDKGKAESIDGIQFFPLLQGMFGLVGGAVEVTDSTLIDALRREFKEETDLTVQEGQITNGLPSFPVTQERKGNLVRFTIRGFNTTLIDTQFEYLRENKHAVFVPNSQLEVFLKDNRTKLRRYVHYVGVILTLQRERFAL